ncbi:MAG: ABC transporter permease [Cyclobacteriaceae bacterium]
MTSNSPPKRAQKFLRWFCDEAWLDELLGDLEEEFIDDVKSIGRRKAVLNYYWQVALLLRPHILRRSQTRNTPIMLKNYLKSAYRNLLTNKVYSAINISGLTVGIACCMLISIYVNDEMSYDKFFNDSDRIYRVALERVYPTNTRYFGSSPVNLAPTLIDNYPEVEVAGRLHKLFFQNEVVVDLGDRQFIEKKYLFADNNFFKVFSFDYLEGDATSALDGPNKIVLTKSTAQRFYGEEQALGKTYNIDTSTYIISAVIEDLPVNSHMSFDILGSIHSLPFLEQAAETNSWINPWLMTYVKLRNDADPAAFEAKLPEMVKSYGLASILSQLQISPDDYPNSGHGFNYFLQPLEDIHLKSNLSVELQANSDIMYVYLLIAVVAFILLISCINFINLATARSAERAKEVGVRKVMGSTRSLLVKQFLTESNLIALIALVLAIALVWLVMPYFNALVGKELSLGVLVNPTVIAAILTFILLVGTLAGLYPALVISSINSALVLKGKYRTSSKGVWLRNGLIIFQFFISITMISGTLMLNKQMNYMRNKQLGFQKENVISIRQTQVIGDQAGVFREELLKIDGVDEASFAFALPGEFIGNLIVNTEDPETPQIRTFTNTFDDYYINALNLEVISGRDFERSFNDSLNVLINETTAALTGYVDPIGKKLKNPSPQQNQVPEFTIVGVVKDFHHQSLHTEIPPMIFFNTNARLALPSLAVKINTTNTLSVLNQIEELWVQFESERPISYAFLDENLDRLYQADLQTGKIFSLFTIVTIIMACVGLFGLAAYVTQQRTKEIGVRKVLGASVGGIILLLSKDFTKLIGFAFLLSLPIVWFGMNEWLNNFAYRTGVDPLTLLAAGILTLVLAWATISYYSIKIAVLNPVKSLRSE